MPVRVFLSHASVDKPFVEDLKHFLEEGGDIECWLDSYEIDFGANIPSSINDGLAKSDFLLLILSPAAIKSRWVEEEWTAAYWPQVNSGKTKLIPVLIGDCQPPFILQNKKYADLRTNQLEGMRQLKTQLVRASPPASAARTTSASLPHFVGREAELSELRTRLSQPGSLVPIIGMPGLGKTYLAREFIRRHGRLFEAVYELDCQKKDLASLSGELTRQLGLRLEGDPSQVAAELRVYLASRRCLLFLDNVDDDQPGSLVPPGRAAVLVTARDGSIPFIADYPDLCPLQFTDAEALDLFRSICGQTAEGPARKLFQKIGNLPIAIAVAAGLIKHDPRHTVESLADSLPPLDRLRHGKNNVGLLLREAIAALNEGGRNLLVAIAACAPASVRLDFAAEVAQLSQSDALDALHVIFSRSLIVELDRATRRYRLHPLIREAAGPALEVRQRHAQQVARRLQAWQKTPLTSAEFIEEAEQALRALAKSPDLLTAEIALRAGNLCRAVGRLGEAYDFYLRLQEMATKAGNKVWLYRTAVNQAVILETWGRLDEAMALLQKQEAICQELGDRDGLQATYGNQALILRAWGRLDQAMALLQKQEAICQELGDRASLQASQVNQALILKAWGRLDEAMALHKKAEAICQELGDRAGLQQTYSNQAGILNAWGRLDDSMALLQKVEAICEELGDRAGLSASYANQAIILRARGRLDEAIALHKKHEAICKELGLRADLARCYWSWGLVAGLQKRPIVRTERLKAALAIFTELKMPRERDAVTKALDE